MWLASLITRAVHIHIYIHMLHIHIYIHLSHNERHEHRDMWLASLGGVRVSLVEGMLEHVLWLASQTCDSLHMWLASLHWVTRLESSEATCDFYTYYIRYAHVTCDWPHSASHMCITYVIRIKVTCRLTRFQASHMRRTRGVSGVTRLIRYFTSICHAPHSVVFRVKLHAVLSSHTHTHTRWASQMTSEASDMSGTRCVAVFVAECVAVCVAVCVAMCVAVWHVGNEVCSSVCCRVCCSVCCRVCCNVCCSVTCRERGVFQCVLQSVLQCVLQSVLQCVLQCDMSRTRRARVTRLIRSFSSICHSLIHMMSEASHMSSDTPRVKWHASRTRRVTWLWTPLSEASDMGMGRI